MKYINSKLAAYKNWHRQFLLKPSSKVVWESKIFYTLPFGLMLSLFITLLAYIRFNSSYFFISGKVLQIGLLITTIIALIVWIRSTLELSNPMLDYAKENDDLGRKRHIMLFFASFSLILPLITELVMVSIIFNPKNLNSLGSFVAHLDYYPWRFAFNVVAFMIFSAHLISILIHIIKTSSFGLVIKSVPLILTFTMLILVAVHILFSSTPAFLFIFVPIVGVFLHKLFQNQAVKIWIAFSLVYSFIPVLVFGYFTPLTKSPMVLLICTLFSLYIYWKSIPTVLLSIREFGAMPKKN